MAGTPKPAAPKVAKVAPAHPPYVVMIKEAIVSLKERSGSSLPAIKKFIETKYGKVRGVTQRALGWVGWCAHGGLHLLAPALALASRLPSRIPLSLHPDPRRTSRTRTSPRRCPSS